MMKVHHSGLCSALPRLIHIFSNMGIKMCHTKVILANEIQSIIIMFHTYIQDILWKNFPDWCLPDKQHPILRFLPVEGRDVLLQLQLYRQTLPSTGGNLRIGCCLSGRHQSRKFFHRTSCTYVWNIIMMLWISFASMAHLNGHGSSAVTLHDKASGRELSCLCVLANYLLCLISY